MPLDADMPEIAILPCLMRGESIEDVQLDRWAPAFGPVYALPNMAMVRMLATLNISTAAYVAAVKARYGINLRSSRRQGDERGRWAWRGDHAAGWRAMHVRADRCRQALLNFDELFEVMEHASYGGQFAIAARMSADLFRATGWNQPLRLSGTMQIDIIDYTCLGPRGPFEPRISCPRHDRRPGTPHSRVARRFYGSGAPAPWRYALRQRRSARA